MSFAKMLNEKKPASFPRIQEGFDRAARSKMVMMARKINEKYHPEMFPGGNPKPDTRFGSII